MTLLKFKVGLDLRLVFCNELHRDKSYKLSLSENRCNMSTSYNRQVTTDLSSTSYRKPFEYIPIPTVYSWVSRDVINFSGGQL